MTVNDGKGGVPTELLNVCPICGSFVCDADVKVAGKEMILLSCACVIYFPFSDKNPDAMAWKDRWQNPYWRKSLATTRAEAIAEVLGSNEVKNLVDTVSDAISVLQIEFGNTMFNANFGRLKEALAAFNKKFGQGGKG